MAAGFVMIGGGASSTSTAALSCPSALGQACGPVDLVIGTVCYAPIPSAPTIGPVTLKIEGRLAYCPEL